MLERTSCINELMHERVLKGHDFSRAENVPKKVAGFSP